MMPSGATWRLDVETDVDPGSLIRILHFFQTRNVTPVYVNARRVAEDECVITVGVEISDLSLDVMKLIAAKVAEIPFTIRATVRDNDGKIL